MKIHRLLPLLACSSFFNPIVCSMTSAQELVPEAYTLPNGMRVLLDPVASSDKVFGGIIVNVGAKHESYDATGLAHYQEHMLFKGTEELGTSNWQAEKAHIDRIFALYDQLAQTTDKAAVDSLQRAINDESVAASQYVIVNEFDKLIKQAGGTGMNAATSWDATVYFNAFPSTEMEKWMALYAHRFEKPVFRGFQAELEVVYEEQNTNADNIATRIYDQFLAAFYPTHPYGSRPLIGKLEHLKRPSLTQMRDFFNTYYVPNNMMLVLTGNFPVERAKTLIEKYFAPWQSKPLPEYQRVEEKPFNGREVVSVRSFPIRAGGLAFRYTDLSPKEEAIEEVTRALFTNTAETGKLDSLSLQGELMAALALKIPLVDQTGILFAFVPKLVGQRFRSAERLVRWAIDDIRSGRFTDKALEIAKQSNLIEWERNMEDPAQRFTTWFEMYIQGKSIADVLRYKDLLKAVTREEVIAFAKKNFDTNYLLFRNKMGLSGGTKIAKPPYKPTIASAKGSSEFADSLKRIPSQAAPWIPITLGKDYEKQDLGHGSQLFSKRNELNEIFTLQLHYRQYPSDFAKNISYLSAMNSASPEGLTLEQYKEELGILGATISVKPSGKSLTISVQGLETNYQPTLELLQRFLRTAHLAKKEKKTFISNVRTEQRVQRKSVDFQVDVLEEYARRGKQSTYLLEPTTQELSAAPTTRYDSIFRSAIHTPCDIYYVGQQSADKLTTDLKTVLPNIENFQAPTPTQEEWEPVEDVDIIFLPNRKATQAKISIIQRVEDYKHTREPLQVLLNSYLSDGFSGLLLQEIREFRSLAYSTYGNLTYPITLQNSTFFTGKLETQGDKAIEALSLYLRLLDSMPQYPERLAEHKETILNALAQRVPSFRSLPNYVSTYERLGFEADPRVGIAAELPNITWEQFYTYYRNQFNNKKRLITIVGDPRTINLKALKAHYRVREVRLKDVLRW